MGVHFKRNGLDHRIKAFRGVTSEFQATRFAGLHNFNPRTLPVRSFESSRILYTFASSLRNSSVLSKKFRIPADTCATSDHPRTFQRRKPAHAVPNSIPPLHDGGEGTCGPHTGLPDLDPKQMIPTMANRQRPRRHIGTRIPQANPGPPIRGEHPHVREHAAADCSRNQFVAEHDSIMPHPGRNSKN